MRGKARQKTGQMAVQAKRTANAVVLTLVLCLAYWRKSKEASKGGGIRRVEGQVGEKEERVWQASVRIWAFTLGNGEPLEDY